MAATGATQVGVESESAFGTDAAGQAAWWHTEIKLAQKFRAPWLKRVKKIVERYRDQGPEGERNDDLLPRPVRFNVLWSNVQTLLPAVYAKAPKPVVERRFLSRDPVGRTASMILERSLAYNLEVGYYHGSTRKSVLDYLLAGQGEVWHRYEPIYDYSQQPALTDTKPTEPSEQAGHMQGPAQQQGYAQPPGGALLQAGQPGGLQQAQSQAGQEGSEQPYATVAAEKVCTDYVHVEDFLTNAARTCDELRWVGKRAYLTRAQLVKRFGDVGRTVPLDYKPKDMPSSTSSKAVQQDQVFARATVWECWHKPDRKVYFVSEHHNEILEVAEDPLHLEGFWPTPEPLLATVANDSIVPVPDYAEYQGQAQELDELTQRIAALTKCIKVAGVYDASVPALKQLLDEGQENKLYPVAKWAEFSEKKGLDGCTDFLPIRDMAEVLIRLHEARAQVKNDLYEITGMSDIVRGASGVGGAKTATEQRIKGQFASLRLSDRQAAVARFCRDSLRIQAEIMAEHFAPETLWLMSGYEQWGPEQHIQAGMNPQQAQQLAMQVFQQAIQLLKSDKLRGFRIEVETDSTVEPDAQAEKQARVEFLGAVAQFLPQALAAATQQPEMAPLMGKMLLFGVRGFRAGRELESAMEETIAVLEKQAQNPKPKPPTPEEMALKTEQLKQQGEERRQVRDDQSTMREQQMESQRAQQDAALEQQTQAGEIAMKQREHQLKMEEMERKAQMDAFRFQVEMAKLDGELQQAHAMAAIPRQQPMNSGAPA
jgi:hypothetical protein